MRSRRTETDRIATLNRTACLSGLSAPARRTDEGDDLTRSRLFSLKAGAEMTAIVEASRDPFPMNGLLAPGRDPAWLCERLCVIQREAKRARARSVYRSAQDVLSLIQRCNTHMPIDWTRVDGRLFVLNKLLAQYEAGLSELEAQTPPELLRETSDTPHTLDAPNSDVTFDPVREIAKQTLTSLLPHASAQEKIALERLMDADLTIEHQPDAPALDKAASDKPMSVKPVSDTPLSKPPEAQAERVPTKTDPAPIDRLEWIMPDLVQRLLEVGRQYGKIFSVSHALDDVLIRSGTTDNIQERLFAVLSELVTGPLPLQGVGRLDLVASDESLIVTGSGFEPVTIALPERFERSLSDIADHIETQPHPGTAVPRPRITADTEDALRDQLMALMDRPVIHRSVEQDVSP